MNSIELRKWLSARGCTFEEHAHSRHGGGHASVVVHLGDKKTVLPSIGTHETLPHEVIERIKADLGLGEPHPSKGHRLHR